MKEGLKKVKERFSAGSGALPEEKRPLFALVSPQSKGDIPFP